MNYRLVVCAVVSTIWLSAGDAAAQVPAGSSYGISDSGSSYEIRDIGDVPDQPVRHTQTIDPAAGQKKRPLRGAEMPDSIGCDQRAATPSASSVRTLRYLSTGRPLSRWKALTAAMVCAPIEPSIGPGL